MLGGTPTRTHRHTRAKEGTRGPSLENGILGMCRTLPETGEGERRPGTTGGVVAHSAARQLSGLGH